MAKVQLTDLVLRDAHQSLIATRMVTADMLPIAEKLDKVGYYALEAWGGATFDTCIRFLNEDPWERLKKLKAALPNTKIMMLLRGQNLLGYRHYADDVVAKFVEIAAKDGVDIFRIFDAVNDPRNFQAATAAAKKTGKHIQAAISYAVTPFHTIEKYAELAKQYADIGADSICIKDMSGLLKPYEAYSLVKAIKKVTDLPIEIHSHATTGMSVATLTKAAEAGAEILDTVISSLAMGTSHSPTETMVEIFRGTEFDTGLDIKLLLEIAAYFRDVRKNYKKFESSFQGADTRILLSQVPGGMLSNLEGQLKEQGAADKIDDVLKEIAVVQKDSGYPPLVTPTSQIVGTQAVFNVLFGRYNKLSGEFQDLLAGKYGACPAPKNQDVVKKALEALKLEKEVTHRPADDIPPEYSKLEDEAKKVLGTSSVSVEDVLTYAMFPKVAPEFFKKRSQGPVVFKPEPAAPAGGAAPAAAPGQAAKYVVNVNGANYNVVVQPAGTVAIAPAPGAAASSGAAPGAARSGGGVTIPAPVAGTVLRYAVNEGEEVKSGTTVLIIESMKMELEIKATSAGPIHFLVPTGTQVASQQPVAEVGGSGGSEPVPAAAPEAAPAAPEAAAPSSGGTVIPSPVAGTVLRYAVNEGAAVKPGDTVVIIESMKMELEIKATAAGAVHFLAPTGAQVASQQPLAEIG
ncbi:oxaloacetate decarboxylase alpha subunit [Treponema primitia ZAS-2]|uniref:Oxaloacetate decarboxylase alpha subunit n=1 Tax=Treponema primitia (strain ATCC BAA-887 / DSM 12427 / ZAS-2) TaxID=545694 RepID=F5YMZ0_TREPZ|nr:sodium-extruding oxaloacetate decarboxylase subunit alpha [Treponema primitia]AEF84478.1 oxaloacetate decarboxylase alpha subunit [Treponema primitia ZAS-2]